MDAIHEHINTARRAAMALLKPTAKDLDHGLELHRHSLVCDTYGFAPVSAVPAEWVKEALAEGASLQELKDLREETMMTRHVRDADERAEFEAAWEAAGVTCIFQNAGEEGQSVPRIIKRLARFTYVVDMMPKLFRRAVRPEQIQQAFREGRRCLYFSANGVPLAEQWRNVQEELGFIRIFFQLGTRMMHLTYNRRNMNGDGCAETANGGLSDFGRAVVSEMNRVGVIVDVAHSGWQTSLEAAQASTRPMVASHTTATALHPHIRSKPDEVIKAIADTGGYVGICAIPRFLGGSGGIDALVDHIDYVARKFGADHVGIGTDSGARSTQCEIEGRKLEGLPVKHRPSWCGFWPAGTQTPCTASPAAQESLYWTNWPMVTVGLVQRGHRDEDIQKIIGGNMLRVARMVLPDTVVGRQFSPRGSPRPDRAGAPP